MVQHTISPEDYAKVHEQAYQQAFESNNRSRSYDIADAYMGVYTQQMANLLSMDFQREESEKAYQRSTVSAQIQQYIDAGFSPQAARNIVSGTASAGSYDPASATIGAAPGVSGSAAGLESATMSNNLRAVEMAGQWAQSSGQMILNSLASSDGGAIGAAASSKTISELMKILPGLPPEARSYYGFMQYAQSSAASPEVKSFYDGEFQSVMKNPFKAKFFQNFMKQSYDFAAGDYTLARSSILADMAKKDFALRQLTWDDEVSAKKAEYMITQLNAEYQSSVTPYQIQSSIASLKAQFADNDLVYQLKTDPEYRKQWLFNAMADERTAGLLATILEKKYTRQTAWLNDPANADFLAIGELMDAAGYNSNFIADMLKASISSGVKVPQAMQKLGHAVNHVLGLPDDVPGSSTHSWSFKSWLSPKPSGLPMIDLNTGDIQPDGEYETSDFKRVVVRNGRVYEKFGGYDITPYHWKK